MKINHSQLEQISKAYRQNKKSNNDQQKTGKKKADRMSISSKAKNIKDIQKSLKDMSGIRQKKVEDLKKAVKNDTYHVDSKDIAEKILSKIDQE